MTSAPDNGSYGIYTDSMELITTSLKSNQHDTAFYIVRHADHTSQSTIHYSMNIFASKQNLKIPQLGGTLSLIGRDSKIHVADYYVGAIKLIYSTAEIFTWKRYKHKTVLVLYGGAGETHEFAVDKDLGTPTTEGGSIIIGTIGSSTIVQWDVSPVRRVLYFGRDLEIHLLWRNDAYNYWVLDLPLPNPISNYVSASRINYTDMSVVVKAGYLVRTANVSNNSLYLTGDVNRTTTIEVIASSLDCDGKLYFNDELVADARLINRRLSGTVYFEEPKIDLPALHALEWKYVDSLPELASNYEDNLWTVADLATTNNTRPLTTPTSLYASDYGYHSGSLIYRGHFVANGNESQLLLSTSGGNSFSHSIWLDSYYLGSWIGNPNNLIYNQSLELSSHLRAGSDHVITVLIDHMGLTENTFIGVETVKDPRGILDYSLTSHSQSDIAWKVTGNLGGEQYRDHSRGPRNEGALFAERQGFHLPDAPLEDKELRSPMLDGVSGVGVGFFSTTFQLNVTAGYDIPLSFVFQNTSQSTDATVPAAYRVQLFVNGWQIGKYGNCNLLLRPHPAPAQLPSNTIQ